MGRVGGRCERRRLSTGTDMQGEKSVGSRGWLAARANNLAEWRANIPMRGSRRSAATSCDWLAELALRALGCMHLGIVRLQAHPDGVELAAAAGGPAGQSRQWWHSVESALRRMAPDKGAFAALHLER